MTPVHERSTLNTNTYSLLCNIYYEEYKTNIKYTYTYKYAFASNANKDHTANFKCNLYISYQLILKPTANTTNTCYGNHNTTRKHI
jgi:hypothetical protein